jgi:OOP family OmpA-OmpF porin
MKSNKKLCLLAAALIGTAISAGAQTPGIDTKGIVGYVIDQRGNVVRSGTGLCWRTGYWTPALAIAECDPDLVKKPEAPPAPKAAPAPAPAVEMPKPVAPPPPPAPKKVSTKVSLGADALFDSGKSQLRPEGQAKLDELAAQLKDVKLDVITVTGHADRMGNAKRNQKLSEERAAAVKARLVEKGIDGYRVYAEGKGSSNPVTKPGDCKGDKGKKLVDCLQPDRRVDIDVVGSREQVQ